MSERVITSKRLGEVLLVTPQALGIWRDNGQLPARGRDRLTRFYLYTHSSVDKWLAACALTPPAPTLAELLAYEDVKGIPSLLTAEEVARRLDRSVHTVWHRLRAGDFIGLALSTRVRGEDVQPYTIRVWSASLTAYLASQTDDTVVGLRYAADMLGLVPSVVAMLIKEGTLESVKRGANRLVKIASLKELIATLIDFGTPDEWWTLRIEHNFEPLYTRKGALAFCKTGYGVLTPPLERGEIAYIRTPGSDQRTQVRIPQHALVVWQKTRTPLPAAALAGIFGVDPSDVRARSFCVRKHNGPQPCPVLQCVDQYIEANKTTSFTAQEWLAWCLQDRMTPLSGNDVVMSCPGMQFDDLDEAFATGQLRGVRLPDGTTAIIRHDALAYRRVWMRRISPDYHRGIDEV